MNNAEMFKKIFGVYAEEFWSYPKDKMLDWLQYENVPDTNVGDTISRQAAIDAVRQFYDEFSDNEKSIEEIIADLPSAQRKGKWTEDEACEFCGFQPWYENDIHTLSFCPNCGARMER